MTMNNRLCPDDDRLRQATEALRSPGPDIPEQLRARVLDRIARRQAPVEQPRSPAARRTPARWVWWIGGSLAAAAALIVSVSLWKAPEAGGVVSGPVLVESEAPEPVDWAAVRLEVSDGLRMVGDLGNRPLAPGVAAARTMASNLSGTYDGMLRAREATRQVNEAVRLLALVPSTPPNPVWVEKGMRLAGLGRSRRN
jgi:hypothetical protein